jgi:hypothetical protein
MCREENEMWKDPIVEEIHAIREQIARECDYDMRKIMERLRQNEAMQPGLIVSKEDLARRAAGHPPMDQERKDAA